MRNTTLNTGANHDAKLRVEKQRERVNNCEIQINSFNNHLTQLYDELSSIELIEKRRLDIALDNERIIQQLKTEINSLKQCNDHTNQKYEELLNDNKLLMEDKILLQRNNRDLQALIENIEIEKEKYTHTTFNESTK